MTRLKQWALIFFGLVFSCILFVPAEALASKITELYVTQGNTGEEMPGEASPANHVMPLGAVTWWHTAREDKYYLFLPAGMDARDLLLWFSADEALCFEGAELTSGQSAGFLLPGNQVILTCGRKEYHVQVMQSKNLSALFIVTESGDMDYIHEKKGNEEAGTLQMLLPDGSVSYDGALEHIKGRGNSSFAYQKKSYQLKLDKSTDLIDAGKAKTWILLSDHRDHSLLRSRIGFALARAVGLDYTSRGESVDVYLNHT